MDHEYNSQIIQESGDQIDLMEESKKESDELLLDAIRGYPHLYNPSVKEYKNILMKENSWSEIARLMNMSVLNCQNRWLRLRERFTKEIRLQESESRSGSGANHRSRFSLYNSMLFLKNHIKRRKSFTNVYVPTKKMNFAANTYTLNNIPSHSVSDTCIIPDLNPPSSSATYHNLSCHNPLMAQTKEAEITRNKNLSCIPQEASRIQSKQIDNRTLNRPDEQNQTDYIYIPQEDDEMQDTTAHNHVVEERNSNETRSEVMSLPSRNESRNSQSSSMSDFSSSSTIQMNRSKNGKIKKKNSTYLESSLATLSDTLQNRLANKPSHSVEKNVWDLSTFTPEKSFGLLVATELERIPEPEKARRKQEIVNILWKPVQ